jgi:hypothetical protein
MSKPIVAFSSAHSSAAPELAIQLQPPRHHLRYRLPPQLGVHAVGRKNYLFAGSDAGGRAAAVLYSVVGTYRRLGLDPFESLMEAFSRIPGLLAERPDEFLPDRWVVGGRGKTA